MKMIETISTPFENRPLVVSYLLDHGWKENKATGIWSNVQRPGWTREIRAQGQRGWVIVQNEPMAVERS